MKEFILFILIGHKTKDKVNRGNDMVSTDKFAATVIILLLLSILFSGCAGEKKTAQAPESIQEVSQLTLFIDTFK